MVAYSKNGRWGRPQQDWIKIIARNGRLRAITQKNFRTGAQDTVRFLEPDRLGQRLFADKRFREHASESKADSKQAWPKQRPARTHPYFAEHRAQRIIASNRFSAHVNQPDLQIALQMLTDTRQFDHRGYAVLAQ